jgi:hypothetical protein
MAAVRKTAGGIVCLATVACFVDVARADGVFVQSDIGIQDQTFVATTASGPLNYSLNFSNYGEGRLAVLGVSYAFDLDGLGTLKVGPTLGFEQEDGTGDETELGVRLTLERFAPTSFGSVFGLVDVGSIDRSWFLLGQVNLQRGLGFEISRGGSDTYHETTFAIQHQPQDGPMRLRLGYRFENREIFVGLNFNTF